MKKIAFCSLLGLFSLVTLVQAQVTEKPKKADKNEPVVVEGRPMKTISDQFDEVVIRKKGDKGTKVIIEINGDKVVVNGKPIEDFDDVNVAVIKRKIPRVSAGVRGSTFRTMPDEVIVQGYPMIGDGLAPSVIYGGPSNKALLGVTSEKTEEEGAKIMKVSEKSAAEKAGLKAGDIITKINEDQIGDPNDLTLVIGKYKPEDKITITYKREGKTQTASATLEKNPGAARYSMGSTFSGTGGFNQLEGVPGFDNYNFNFDSFGDRALTVTGRPRLGIKAQETEEGDGLKVLEVWNESQAEKAGIKEGDIITRFDDKKITTTEELLEAAKNSKDKTVVKVELKRDGKTQTVEIKTPKKLKTANL